MISGSVERLLNMLSLRYTLSGSLEAVSIPAPADNPARTYALWKDTCFEFFLKAGNADRYWEFNLSPSGHWNVYRFRCYRHGMEEEPAFTILPFSVEKSSHALRLFLNIDLAPIIPAGQACTAGISTVIKTADGRITYWALNHPGPQADFHHQDSFFIKL